jgi:hypothetical protein
MQRNLTRELAHRAGDGVEVTLLWSSADNRLTVAVSDSRSGASFELPARPESALDVFYHPFAHAAFEGVAYEHAGTLAESQAA